MRYDICCSDVLGQLFYAIYRNQIACDHEDAVTAATYDGKATAYLTVLTMMGYPSRKLVCDDGGCTRIMRIEIDNATAYEHGEWTEAFRNLCDLCKV